MKTKNKSCFLAGIATVLLCIASINTGFSQTTSEEWANLGKQYSVDKWYFMAAEAFKKAAEKAKEDNYEMVEDHYWYAATYYWDTASMIKENVKDEIFSREWDDDLNNDTLSNEEKESLIFAIACLDSSLKMGYDNDVFVSIKAISYNYKGDIYILLGQYQEAIINYHYAADKYTKFYEFDMAAESFKEAGEACLDIKDFNKAYDYYSVAAVRYGQSELYKNVSVARLYAGYAKNRLKEYIEAASVYIEAGEDAEEHEFFGNAGYAYDAAGHAIKYTDWSAAQNYWNKAKTNFTKEGMGYEIPPDFQVEIDTPYTAHSLWAELISEIDTFKQGEAIQMSCKITYKGQPQRIKLIDKGLSIEVIVPNCNAPFEGRNVQTGSSNQEGIFSDLPFAGFTIGLYGVVVKAEVETYVARDTAFLVVEKHNGPKDFDLQIDKLMEYYVKAVDEGVIWKIEGALEYVNEKFPNDPIKKGSTKAGSRHNQIFSQKIIQDKMFIVGKDENGDDILSNDLDPAAHYTCEGYQLATLDFLNMVRFNENPEIRELLDGIDYGPIQQYGYYSILPKFGESYDGYFHLGTVLYNINKTWSEDVEAVVFDPWFTQTPQKYKLKNEWAKIASPSSELFVGKDKSVLCDPEKNIWNGFPINGSCICSNTCKNEFFNRDSERGYRKPKNCLSIECPVNILIVNEENKKTGVMTDGKLLQEFQANLYCILNEDNDKSWYVELPDGSYTINITGEDDGEFYVVLIADTTQNEPFFYGTQSIQKDSTATIYLGSQDQPPDLILPDGIIVKPNSEQTYVDTRLITSNKMYQNNPNPFYRSTEISYVLSRNMHAKMEVFDIAGRCVKTLVNTYKTVGFHMVQWDGCGESGNKLQSGIYFYRLTTDNWINTKKMYLVRK